MRGHGEVELTRKESLFWFEDEAKESIEERIAPPLSSDRSRFIATWSSTWQHHMTIPKEIAAEKDLYSKSQLVVRDFKEKLWFMKLSTAEDGSVNLTEKWASFYESHGLKEGDSCVFEFIGSRIVHVQIISASSVMSHAGVEDVLLRD
uniref:TF-B3 domain-containing protein n=1 Tax=Kalanchoe fedtschenkoi TaxID=63787 RepID=A0A7N0VI01_KALFE